MTGCPWSDVVQPCAGWCSPNSGSEAHSRICSKASLRMLFAVVGREGRKCGGRPRHPNTSSLAATSPNASDIRRSSPQVSHLTSKSTASSEAPVFFSRKGPLHAAAPRCMKRNHRKSSRWMTAGHPEPRRRREREPSGLTQFAWTKRARSGR